jgi:hypothetical protein
VRKEIALLYANKTGKYNNTTKTTNTTKGRQQYREINQKIEKPHADRAQAENRKRKGRWKFIAVGTWEKA